MTSHRLRLNDLLLSTGEDEEGTSDPSGRWWWDVYGSDFTTGAAEPVEVTMRTLLQDGARVVTTGYGNREVGFYAVVGGVDSGALAHAEQELALHLGRRGELGWIPSDGWAPETVFDVETSSMVAGGPENEDDLIEVQHNERVYRLRFVCQPHPRAAEKTVVAAVAAPVEALDEDVLNAGTSLTRWSTRLGGVLNDRGAYLQVTNSRSPRAIYTPAAPVSLATQPYISVIAHYGGAPYCFVNGVAAELVGAEGAYLTDTIGQIGATRYFWHTDQTELAKVEFAVNFASINPFDVADVRIRNLPPFSGTQRQSRRSIQVGGSVRTQGTVQIAAPEGESLGTVLLYTTTTGSALSSLGQYATTETVPSPDADAVSGYARSLSDGTGFDIPVPAIAAGKHQILARLRDTSISTPTARAVTWAARVFVGAAQVGPTVSGTATVTLDEDWQVVTITSTTLPTVDLPPESQAVVRLTFDTIFASIDYDEMWALNLDEGQVTIVEAGAHQRVWIETATTARPRPAIYIGDTVDQSDAFHDPNLVGCWGDHEFSPPLTNALIVTSGCNAAAGSFEYYRRAMNFIADPMSVDPS